MKMHLCDSCQHRRNNYRACYYSHIEKLRTWVFDGMYEAYACTSCTLYERGTPPEEPPRECTGGVQ